MFPPRPFPLLHNRDFDFSDPYHAAVWDKVKRYAWRKSIRFVEPAQVYTDGGRYFLFAIHLYYGMVGVETDDMGSGTVDPRRYDELVNVKGWKPIDFFPKVEPVIYPTTSFEVPGLEELPRYLEVPCCLGKTCGPTEVELRVTSGVLDNRVYVAFGYYRLSNGDLYGGAYSTTIEGLRSWLESARDEYGAKAIESV